jgi:tetratricopeptide (TPR) repeat protein
MKARVSLAASALALAICLAPGDAAAQASSPPGDTTESLPEKGKAPEEKDLARAQKTDERPWARGVTPERQQKALAAFAEANALLRDALFVKAAATYREALSHWDHPAIHYNLALALVNLDQPVEMFHELEKAMAFGAAPLDDDKFERARQYKLLVQAQLARVEISCDTAGARVSLDGKELFVAPGKYEGLTRTGEHTVLARGAGYAPTQLTQKLGSGEVMRLHLKLFTDAELTRERRVMPAWVPWTVLGGGVVIAGVGGLLHGQSKDDFASYDEGIAQCAAAAPDRGCANPGVEVNDRKTSAESKQTLAITAYAIGGVAIVTGVTLAIINRAESYRIDPLADKPRALSVSPLVGPGFAGVTAQGRF